MKTRSFALASTPTALSGAVLSVLALAGLGIVATTNTEAVVADQFAAALESPLQRNTETRVATADRRHPIAGTEAYWLDRNHPSPEGAEMEAVTWSAPLAADLSIGDRINIPNRSKGNRILEVVAVADVEPAPGTAESRNPSSERQIAVTFRDLTASNGAGPLVTFVVPAGTNLAASQKLPQTL